MDIEVRPCSSVEELRDALNVISHYFGHENQLEDAERFAKWIEVERMHVAFAGDRMIGGAGAFTFQMSVPGGALIPAAGITVVGVLPTHRRRGVLTSLMQEQLADCRARVFPFIKNFIHFAYDWQIDSMAQTELARGAAGGHAFGDHGCLRENFFQLPSAAERHSDAAVSREVSSRRQHQVAQSGQPAQRARVASHSNGKTRALGEPACDQSGHAVASQTQAAANSRADGDHVLHRCSDFDAGYVTARVETQRRRCKCPLYLFGELDLFRCNHHGRGLACSNLFCEGRTG